MGGLRIVTPPAQPVLTLSVAKQHLRVDHDDDDEYIQLLIDGVTSFVDAPVGILGLALVQQTWDYYLDAFPSGEIIMPFGPLQTVTSVKYDDTAAAEQTLVVDTDYRVDLATKSGRIYPASSWPSTIAGRSGSVRVRFSAGYPVVGSASSTPGAIKMGMLLMVGDAYENRETVVIGQTAFRIPSTAEHLFDPFINYLR